MKKNFNEIIKKSVELRKKYHELEKEYHGSEWTLEEDVIAYLSDSALVGRLIMDRKGRWPADTSKRQLEHKLAENIWWILTIADRLNINIEEELENFFEYTDKKIND